MTLSRRPMVHRARVSDADRVADFVNQAHAGRLEIDDQTVIRRLVEVGFLLAERDGDIVGLLGWRAENLIVRVTDLLVWPASERDTVSGALLGEMERLAMELRCEMALLTLLQSSASSPSLIEFYGTLGYTPRFVASMPRAWAEVAREIKDNNEMALIKQLSEDRVSRPL